MSFLSLGASVGVVCLVSLTASFVLVLLHTPWVVESAASCAGLVPCVVFSSTNRRIAELLLKRCGSWFLFACY